MPFCRSTLGVVLLAFLLATLGITSPGYAGSIGPSGGGGISGPSLYVYPQTFGAIPDAKVFYAGAMTNGSSTLTDTTDNPFVPGSVGKLICVGGISGTWGPNNAGSGFGPLPQSEKCGTITAYTSASTVTTSFSSSNGGSVTNETFRFGTDNTNAVQATLNSCATNGCTVAFTGPFAVQNTIIVPVSAPINLIGTSAYAPDANLTSSHIATNGSATANGSGIWCLTKSLTAACVDYGDVAIATIVGNGTTATVTFATPYPVGLPGMFANLTIEGNSNAGFNGSPQAASNGTGTQVTFSSGVTGSGTGGVLINLGGGNNAGASVQNTSYTMSNMMVVGGSGPTNCQGATHCQTGYFGTYDGGGADGIDTNGMQNIAFYNDSVVNFKLDCIRAYGNNNEFINVYGGVYTYCGQNGINYNGGNFNNQFLVQGAQVESMGGNGVIFNPTGGADYGVTSTFIGNTIQWNGVINTTGTANLNIAGGNDHVVIGNYFEGSNGSAGIPNCLNSGGSNVGVGGHPGSQLFIGNNGFGNSVSCEGIQFNINNGTGGSNIGQLPTCTSSFAGTLNAIQDGAGTTAAPTWSYGGIYTSGAGTAVAEVFCDGANWRYNGGGGANEGAWAGSAPSVAASTTNYVAFGEGATATAISTETNAQSVAPGVCIISNLYVNQATAATATHLPVYKINDNTTGQSVTCSVAGAATTCNDTAHSFVTAAGDLLDVSIANPASASATGIIRVAFQMAC